MGSPAASEAPSSVFLRPIASPLPLGFLALAVGTFTMAGLELSWIAASQQRAAGLAILAFVVPLQFISSIFGFLGRDSAAGVGVGVQAGGWLAIGISLSASTPGHVSGALGLILLGAGTALLIPATTAFQNKVLAGIVITLTALRFYLTAAYELSDAASWKLASAITGLVLAGLAAFAALALELEDARGRTILPTLRRGAGRQAITGSLADQVSSVHQEAGVRRKL